jgi:hypothetical protein
MSELNDKFGIKERVARDLMNKPHIKPITPSDFLKKELEEWLLSHQNFQLFSGYTFNVSESDKLTGVCDYLFSTEKTITEVRSAVFCVIEAKNRAVIEGVPQAFAEMYAAQIFNEIHHKPTPIVFGCVTNATEWLFLKLENREAYIDMERYFSTELNLPILIGVLKQVVDFYCK